MERRSIRLAERLLALILSLSMVSGYVFADTYDLSEGDNYVVSFNEQGQQCVDGKVDENPVFVGGNGGMEAMAAPQAEPAPVPAPAEDAGENGPAQEPADPKAGNDPVPEGEKNPDGDPDPQPVPGSEGEKNPEGDPDPKPVPGSEGEKNPEGDPDPQPVPGAEGEKNPDGDPDPQPVPGAEGEKGPEGSPDPKPVPGSEGEKTAGGNPKPVPTSGKAQQPGGNPVPSANPEGGTDSLSTTQVPASPLRTRMAVPEKPVSAPAASGPKITINGMVGKVINIVLDNVKVNSRNTIIDIGKNTAAAIELRGENILNAAESQGDAAIHIADAGSKLTITGPGELTANADGGAAIGSNAGEDMDAEIRIGAQDSQQGPKVTVNSKLGAGIGSGANQKAMDLYRPEAAASEGTDSGSGGNMGGSIIVEGKANLEAFSVDGAGIGSGALGDLTGSVLLDVTDADISAGATENGAGIGTGSAMVKQEDYETGMAVTAYRPNVMNGTITVTTKQEDKEAPRGKLFAAPSSGAGIGSGLMGNIGTQGKINFTGKSYVDVTTIGGFSAAIGTGAGYIEQEDAAYRTYGRVLCGCHLLSIW